MWVYTYPSKKALASIVGRVRTLTRRSSHPTLAALLRQLNPVTRGWCTYFRPGVSKATFGYLDQYTWHRVVRWIRKRHNKTKWEVLWRRYLPNLRPVEDGVVLFQPQGHGQPLPLPGREHPHALAHKTIRNSRIAQRHGLVESRMRGDTHVRFGGRDEET